MSFVSSIGTPSSMVAERKAVSWRASVQPSKGDVRPAVTGNRATWEQVCAVKPSHREGEPAEISEPSTQPSEGSAAYENDGTLQWELRTAR